MKRTLTATFCILATILAVSCKKESTNSNVEKLLMEQYKESEYFYSTNLTDFQSYIEQYISQNPQLGLYPSFDSIRKIKMIVDRTITDIDKLKGSERQKMVTENREAIAKLSNYKFDFVALKSLEGLNDSLYNQAVKSDLLKANYNIYLQYSHTRLNPQQ